MNPADILKIIPSLTAALGVKVFLLTFIVFYIILAALAIRQVTAMTEVLDVFHFSAILKVVAALNLLAAIVVLFIAILL